MDLTGQSFVLLVMLIEFNRIENEIFKVPAVQLLFVESLCIAEL